MVDAGMNVGAALRKAGGTGEDGRDDEIASLSHEVDFAAFHHVGEAFGEGAG